MTKAQEMLAKAGFPDTKQGRAAFHKMYPSPEDFFKVHGNVFKDFPDMFPIKLPIKPENIILNHSPDREYYLSNLDTSDTSDKNTYRRGGPIMYGDGTKVYSTSNQNTSQVGNNYQNTYQTASTNIDPNGNTSQQFIRQTNNPNQTPYFRYFNDDALGSEINIAGGNGNNMFFTPDPMMANFLKTRSNYLSGAMAGEQMKRNGGLIRYADGGPTGGEEKGQFSPAKEYYKGWYSSPMYKSIIANQAKSLFPDNENKQTKFINKWTAVPNDEYWDTYANPKVEDFDIGAFGYSVPGGNIFLKDSFVKNNPTLANSLFAHEIKHKLPATSYDDNHVLELTPKFDANIHKPGGNFDNQGVWHDTTSAYDNYLDKTDPDEVGTEIHAIRQLAKQAGVYDPYTEPFTKEHIDKLEKLYQEGGPDGKNFNQIGRLRKYYSDDQVIDMMNTISQNKGQSGDNIQMAALGSFVGGPPEDEYSYLKGSMSAPYDRFPKKDPGFNNGPGTYWSYMDRLKNRKVHYANPHKGVKDTPVNMHTITDSCESGNCYEFKEGGVVDAYQLMGMPTPPMYGYGSHINHYIPSYNFGHVQSKNNTYRHGYANGGHVGMYGFGSTIKDLGYGMADMSLGTIGGLTGIQSMQDIVDEDQYSNDKFDDVTNFAGKLQSAVVKNIPGVGQVVGAVGGGLGALANTTFKIDERNYDPSQHTSNWDKWGNIVGQAGDMASMFTNPASAASSLSKGAKTAMNIGKIAGLGATAVKAGQDIDKSRGGTYDPTNALNLGMGIAKSGFFGGNTNTSSNFGNNTKGAADYTPIVDGPLYAAMGGAVNAPNMMKYDDGGMAPQANGPTQINVERGELLVNKDGKILTEYKGNGMVPHPADGSMDPRGTVPAQEGQFVITKRLAPDYKAAMTNNDKLYATAMRNNIAFDKQRKEAKQQAQQQAQQEMMQDMMMARNGGMIRKYDGGSTISLGNNLSQPSSSFNMWNNNGMFGGTQIGNESLPGYDLQNFLNLNGLDGISGLNPESVRFMMNNSNAKNANSMQMMTPRPAQPLPTSSIDDLNVTRDPRVSLTPPKLVYGDPGYNERTESPYKEVMPTGGSANDGFDAGNATTPEELARMDASSPQEWNTYARAQNNPSKYDYTSTSALGYNDGTTSNGFDPNYFNLQRALGYAGPAALGMEALLSKAFNMNAADYQIKGKIDPYEEEYVADYRPYNAAVANLNRLPGSGNLAARTNLFNAMQQQQDDARYKISLANAQRKMAAQQANLGIEGQNLSTAMNIAQFNEQNKANRRNAIREQFGKNLPAVAYNDMANQMAMAGMSAAYPEYNFPWNKKRGV